MENKLTTHRLKNMATHSNRILGPQLARAWVTTVINPIFERVQKEQHWLHKKNWFWIYTTGWFEYFAPISGYIDLRYYANYELFCEQYQAIAGLFDEHDKSLDNLATALGSLYKKISILPKFQTEFQKLESESRIKDIN